MKRIVSAALLVLALLPPSLAHAITIPFTPHVQVYAVKFVCGLQSPVSLDLPREPPVKPGNYATAVNILNFHTFPVTICKKAVVALPESCLDTATNPPPGVDCHPHLAAKVVTLNSEQAMEVDCDDIVRLFAGASLPPFIKGFVEIVVFPNISLPAVNPLGVTGVYTAEEARCAQPAPTPQTICPVSVEVEPQNSQTGEIPAVCSPTL